MLNYNLIITIRRLVLAVEEQSQPPVTCFHFEPETLKTSVGRDVILRHYWCWVSHVHFTYIIYFILLRRALGYLMEI